MLDAIAESFEANLHGKIHSAQFNVEARHARGVCVDPEIDNGGREREVLSCDPPWHNEQSLEKSHPYSTTLHIGRADLEVDPSGTESRKGGELTYGENIGGCLPRKV